MHKGKKRLVIGMAAAAGGLAVLGITATVPAQAADELGPFTLNTSDTQSPQSGASFHCNAMGHSLGTVLSTEPQPDDTVTITYMCSAIEATNP